MIIVNKKISTVKFSSLSFGEVFRDNHSNICMKIESTDTSNNVVYLVDGATTWFDDYEDVERVDCELVVKNP